MDRTTRTTRAAYFRSRFNSRSAACARRQAHTGDWSWEQATRTGVVHALHADRPDERRAMCGARYAAWEWLPSYGAATCERCLSATA